jgi:nucleoside-diphosphate-sugar epimerase
MTILITRVHSFVGSNLVSFLKSEHSIYGLDIKAPYLEGVIKTYTWTQLDDLPKVDVIIHLAGKAHDTKNQTDAQVYFDVNTGLTRKIYDWFIQSQTSKFIFFSSVKAAVDKIEGILNENVKPDPHGPYGESKFAAENYLLAKQQKNGQFPSQNTYIIRPCMIHGPGNKGNLNLLYRLVRYSIPYPLGAFENKRSFTSIDNLNFVIGQLIIKDVPSGIYNMADDESLSTNELIALMCRTMKKPNRIWNWNKTLIQWLAKIGTFLHLPFNDERLQKLTENYLVSNVKLKTALKISKMPLTGQDGFVKTIHELEKK